MLARRPLVSISEVRLSDAIVLAALYKIDDAGAGILFKETGWQSTVLMQTAFEAFIPPRPGEPDWAVDYVAGYIMPGFSTGVRDLPFDLERACIEIVKTLWHRRKDDPLVKSQRIGDASETLFSADGFPPPIKRTLDRWRQLL